MDDKLLVRLYNVGLGDCIYLRVPDRGGAKHLLIDCGNKFGAEEHLRVALADLRTHLPEVPGDAGLRRLDLLVATHAHEDHVRGFNLGDFAGIRIEHLWMSTAMNPDHPQAEKAKALHAFALGTLERLQSSSRAGLAEWATAMLGLSKGEGLDALTVGLKPVRRLYVHAETPEDDLKLFDDPAIRLSVLAPMNDIDRFYLGRETALAFEGFQAMRDARLNEAAERGLAPQRDADPVPPNVSREDFDRLRRSLNDQALAFVFKEGELVNNTSVVLLLEWRGRRLLFTGDAEVKTAFQGSFQKDRGNGSWNVMWHRFKETSLSQPVDFLKVGHHGSHNATPWTGKASAGGAHPINEILDRLLPPQAAAEARAERYAVVSTERSGYPTIPDPSLMMELGSRVSNGREYEEPAGVHSVPARRPQPPRTDLETIEGHRVPWIDVELAEKAAGGIP